MIAKFDKYYPIAIGALAGILHLLLFSRYPKYALPVNIRDLITAATTIASIAVGFLATAKAILVSMNNSEIIQWMKDGGLYDTTIDYFVEAIYFCMSTAVLSGLLLLIDFKDPIKIALSAVTVWVFLSVTSLLATHRVIRLFSTLLKK